MGSSPDDLRVPPSPTASHAPAVTGSPAVAPRRNRAVTALMITLGLCAAAIVGVLIGHSSTSEPADSAVTVVKPSPSVVVALRDLSRLEGTVFHIERVVDLREKQSRFFDLIQAEDAVLLVAAGDVTAGVDLSGLREGSVVADPINGRAIIQLPRATILSRSLDNQRTYVHTRQTDSLAQRRENLETRARQEAERTLEKAALDAGILAKAEDSVGRTVESLVRSLGYREIEVRFVGEATPGASSAAPTKE